jgi:hypothetical protein
MVVRDYLACRTCQAPHIVRIGMGMEIRIVRSCCGHRRGCQRTAADWAVLAVRASNSRRATFPLFTHHDLIVLDHLGPAFDLVFEKTAEGFRRGQSIINALFEQALPDCGLLQGVHHGGIHLGDNLGRRFRWREQAPPRLGVEPRDCEFADGWRVQQLRDALLRRCGQRPQRAGGEKRAIEAMARGTCPPSASVVSGPPPL